MYSRITNGWIENANTFSMGQIKGISIQILAGIFFSTLDMTHERRRLTDRHTFFKCKNEIVFHSEQRTIKFIRVKLQQMSLGTKIQLQYVLIYALNFVSFIYSLKNSIFVYAFRKCVPLCMPEAFKCSSI